MLPPHKREANAAMERRCGAQGRERERQQNESRRNSPSRMCLSLFTQCDLCAYGVLATRSAMQTGHTSHGSDRSGHDPGQEFSSRASLPERSCSILLRVQKLHLEAMQYALIKIQRLVSIIL